MRDRVKSERLADWVAKTIHSREEWEHCNSTWEDVDDDVERAARWLYVITYSFGGIGRNFGRSTGGAGFAGKLANKATRFASIHERFKAVQVENMDAVRCIKEYDHPDAVIYVDPDYGTDASVYKHTMNAAYHRRLLETIFQCRGFVAVSGYSNPLFENQDWDARYQWESYVSVTSPNLDSNHKAHLGASTRSKAVEVLWIKEAE